jgi:hypothetical protein
MFWRGDRSGEPVCEGDLEYQQPDKHSISDPAKLRGPPRGEAMGDDAQNDELKAAAFLAHLEADVEGTIRYLHEVRVRERRAALKIVASGDS